MLKVRVIPTLLMKGVGLVKGVGFDSWRRVGTLLPAVKVYNQREVDELIMVDIGANQSNEDLDYETISDMADDCFVPLTVGGGIKEMYQVEKLLANGADKVSLNSSLYSDPSIIDKISHKFGSQCIVASVDVVGNQTEGWTLYSHSGAKLQEQDVFIWINELENRGAGEILLTSINRDGTMEGYDLPLVQSAVEKVNIPVIASGGAGSYQHMIDAVLISGASAVAAASIFYFSELTPLGAKQALRDAGIPVRKKFTLLN